MASMVVVIGLIGLIGLLLCTKITVRLEFQMHGMHPEGAVEVLGFFHLLRIRIRWPQAAGGPPSPGPPPPGKRRQNPVSRLSLQDGRALWRIGRAFLRRVSIEKWEMATAFGTGQTHVTGWLVGWFWWWQHWLHTQLSHAVTFRERPRITVRPDFQRTGFHWRFHCIATFRLGHAIIAGVRWLGYWIWTRKAREHGGKGS